MSRKWKRIVALVLAYFTGSVRSYGVHDDATYLKFDFGTASVTITATGD